MEALVNAFDPAIVVIAIVVGLLIRNKPYRLFWIPAAAIVSRLGLHTLTEGGGSPAVSSLAGALVIGLFVAYIFTRIQQVTPDHKA